MKAGYTHHNNTHGKDDQHRNLGPPRHPGSKQHRQDDKQNRHIRADVEYTLNDLVTKISGAFALGRRQRPVSGHRMAVKEQSQFRC